MLQNCKIGAIVFFVSDLARSMAFYGGTLGLPVERIDGHDGPFAMGQVGELFLVLIVHPAKAGDTPVVVFSLDGGIDDYAEARVDRSDDAAVWWRADLTLRNPITSYRFLLDGGSGGVRQGRGALQRQVVRHVRLGRLPSNHGRSPMRVGGRWP
jgi:catechol 2,3-dioxygenase-like lactoylglutathione lyase family enzyme